jgi:hypothetical protein
MDKGNRYPEKRDIRAIAILLATQAMIHLGAIADPLHGQKTVQIEGARFYIDLLAELQGKTRGNLQAEDAAFINDTLANLQSIIGKKDKKEP